MKKGISPFIAFVLVVVISIASTMLVLRFWGNSMEKVQGYAMVNEAKGVMSSIGSAVREVSAEGEGSSRLVSMTVSGGEYRASAAQDSVTYVLDGRGELFSAGTVTEGDLVVETYSNDTVVISIDCGGADILTDGRWPRGSYNVLVRNNGTSSGRVQLVFENV